ncbi:tRNA pseudouridine(13) synthase TruD [Aliidiomarina iranensis]|uniref:tRNA pseudouridine synthase D n=1 Tax=Aliidiomarina iranensis TaxID=1434071 RepID=A0A432W0I4_9GAMM|nr:tRNA pseudouridine(13) synthase TruD [Aliidiomarina iranensis]RUO22502.1 tRNA pseudouridine(13) synthase TruD [Aliidiomarina iranensis]
MSQSAQENKHLQNAQEWHGQWQRKYPGAVPSGTYKTQHSDFVVHENLGFVPEAVEKGQHHWLYLEKQGMNTAQVAKNIARYLGISVRDISFSGMKDRFGITRQWFSVELPALQEPDWQACIQESFAAGVVQLLEHVRSHRKLRRGVHKSNSFRIVLRDINDMALLQSRLEIIQQGVPNYFGEQRFGIARQNLSQALAMFAGKRIKNRDLRGILLSSARSWLFNHYLSARMHEYGDDLMSGDVFMLSGSQSFFTAEVIDSDIETRLAAADIQLSGPLYGDGEILARGYSAAFEQRVLGEWPEFTTGLSKARLRQERRALWLLPDNFQWQPLADHAEGNAVELSFDLPTGTFATALLAELGEFVSGERKEFNEAKDENSTQ